MVQESAEAGCCTSRASARGSRSFTFTSIANYGPVGKHVVHPEVQLERKKNTWWQLANEMARLTEKKPETAGPGRWMWQDGPFSYLITQANACRI
jgi:hypothetical protein